MWALTEAEVEALGVEGFFLRDGVLGEEAASEVRRAALARVNADLLKPAGVRRGADFRREPETRSDMICWVEPTAAEPGFAPVLSLFRRLGESASAQAYLGLRRFDVQLAHYAAGGARYARHRDAFPGNDNRRLTALYYLNPGWRLEHGGMLRLYLAGGPRDVEPLLDRMVVFLSERVEHEVLPSFAPRLALTAWYYSRGAG